MSILKELVSVPDALIILKAIKGRSLFLGLYHSLFPEEYAASEKSTILGTGKYKTYSPKEAEFLELVHENYFPIYPQVYMDERKEARTDYIPIQAMGFQPCGCSDWEDILISWQIVMVMSGDYNADDLITDFDRVEVLEGLEWLGVPDDYPLFESLCGEMAGDPLNNPSASEEDQILQTFPWLFKVAFEDSNNAFLDSPTCCQRESYRVSWTEEFVKDLQREWKEAQEVKRLIYDFENWLTSDIDNLRKVVKVWNELGRRTGYVKS